MEKIFDIAKDSEKSWGTIATAIDGNNEKLYYYSNPTSGVIEKNDNDKIFLLAVTSLWLEVLDESIPLPDKLYCTYLGNSSGNYKTTVRFDDASGKTYFSKAYNDGPKSGMEELQIYTASGSGVAGKYILHVIVNWDSIINQYLQPNTEINTSSLNRQKVTLKLSQKDKVSSLELRISTIADNVENMDNRVKILEDNITISEDPILTFELGKQINESGTIEDNPDYSLSNIIHVRGKLFKLYYNYIETKNITAGFMAYYDKNMQFLGSVRSNINDELLSQSSYVRFSIYSVDQEKLNKYAIRTGYDDEYWKTEENKAIQAISGYRYIIPTFGVIGMTNVPRTSALILLGSNDLLRFSVVARKFPYVPKKCEGVRDPSIIKIDDYYYIVYTNGIYLNSTNEIGMCRTKDFIHYEELDNLALVGEGGEDFSNGYCWAPAWYKEDDKFYLVVGCSKTTNEDGQTEDFYHYIYDYDVDNHVVSQGYKTNAIFIDGHVYKQNGIYYLLGSAFRLWKSNALKSKSWENLSPYLMPHIEGQFCIRKDDGNLRIFAQKVPYIEDGVNHEDSHYYYLDGGSNLETGFDLGNLKQIKIKKSDSDWAHEEQGNTEHEFWHFTIYDTKCWLDNNNNYQ